MNNMPYNSALSSKKSLGVDRSSLTDTEHARNDRGLVFFHDIVSPIPLEYQGIINRKVDCIYTEAPWKDGYYCFQDRAEMAVFDGYDRFLEGLYNNVVCAFPEKPIYIVASIQIAKKFSQFPPTPIKLNNDRAWLTILNAEMILDVADSKQLIKLLSSHYNSVYDCCCGYGNTFPDFNYFIGSDIDKKCLNFIKRNLLT